jgi:hypothetical protein
MTKGGRCHKAQIVLEPENRLFQTLGNNTSKHIDESTARRTWKSHEIIHGLFGLLVLALRGQNQAAQFLNKKRVNKHKTHI